jgi:hypothetical protein
MAAAEVEPEISFASLPSVPMSVRSDGYGVGLLWCSHLRAGRREITHWFDSPARKLKEINESIVTRRVELLGRPCFEVQIREQAPGRLSWSGPKSEYFWVGPDGTHWVRPKKGNAALDDSEAWELQDSDEGVEPFEVSTESPAHDSAVEAVDLTVGDRRLRCLRETFFEYLDGAFRYGGDAFRRQDGTTIYYRRLLAETSDKYPTLEGADEYEWKGVRFRVWESVLLAEEDT